MANSGTSLRFLTAMLATGQGTYRLDGTPRMRQRPVADLLTALNGLGADARSRPRDRLPAGDHPGRRAGRRLCLRQGGRLQPVPQRPADGVALFATGDHGRGQGRAGLAALRVDDAGRDGGLRRDGSTTASSAASTSIRRTTAAASSPSSPTPRPPAISSPWRRSRAGRSPSRAWAARASRATWRSWTSWNTWAAPSPASRPGRPSPAGRSAPSTST